MASASKMRWQLMADLCRASTSLLGYLLLSSFFWEQANRTSMKFSDVFDALSELLRERRRVYAHLLNLDNVKVVAYELARQRCQTQGQAAENGTTALPSEALPSMLCLSQDWTSAWLPYWANRIGMQPAYHRKLWEFAYIMQVLSEAGVMRAGTRGLGFGCGKEPLASLLVHAGCEIVATDLAAVDSRARGWSAGEQHADSLKSVWMPALCSHEEAETRLRFRPVDMNAVPADLYGKFDFCWSSCALEHLGSIERGLDFIRASARCLRPSGIGVHTTELKLDRGPTLETGATVLFQLQHFEELSRRLADDGVEMRPVSLRQGDPFMDGYVDVPPYPDPTTVGSTLSVLHLRLLIGAHRSTSIGIIMRRLT